MADPGVQVGPDGRPIIYVTPLGPSDAQSTTQPGASPQGQPQGAGWGQPWMPAPAAQATPQSAGWGQPWQPDQPSNNPPVGPLQAAGRGAIEGLTVGAAPAISGLSAASKLNLNPPADSSYTDTPEGPVSTDPVGDLATLGKIIASPFVGAYNLATGQPGASDIYDQARAATQAEQDRAQQEQPGAYLAGQFGSALAIPAAGGLKAATTLGRIANSARAGAIGGAAFGGGTAIGQGEGPLDVAKQAALGGVAGGGLGIVGSAALEGASTLGSKVASALRGHGDVDAEAARKIVNALRSDFQNEGPQFTPDQVRALRNAGTETAVVDAGGERTRAMARSAANTSPEARGALTELTGRRFEQQGERISGAIDNLVGGSNVDLDALRSVARKANAPLYKRAYAAGDARFSNGIRSPELERLLSSEAVPAAMARAVQKGRNRAVAEGMGGFNPKVQITKDGRILFGRGQGVPAFPDLQLWDYTQRALRDMATEAQRAGRNDEAGALFALHKQLRNELDHKIPEFARARGSAAFFKGAEDAYEAGQNFVSSNADLNGARKALQQMNPAERDLFARGFASELADKILQVRDRRNVLNSAFLDTPKSREAINLALGPQRAAKLETLLRAETLIDRMRQALGNSTTARQLAEMGLAGGAVATFEGLREHSFNPASIIGAALLVGAARHGVQVIDHKVAQRVGEMLASNDAAVLQKGLQLVSSRPVLLDALRRGTDASIRQIINSLGPQGTLAAGATLLDHVDPPQHEAPSDYYDNQQQPAQP